MIYDIDGNALYLEQTNISPVLDADDILTVSEPTTMFSSFSAVYDAYDDLFENMPHEKNLLGYGTNSSGLQDTSLPIYEYALLNPIEPNNPTNPNWAIKSAPKVCLVSGVHGNERGAVVALFNCIRAVVNQSDDAAQTLRNAAQYRIVPVVNPGGYNDNTRDNRHGVNLARNFSYNWGDGEHPGTAPYSEYETKALKAWCDAQAPTTLFMVDFHNHLASQITANDPPQSPNYFYIYTDLQKWKEGFSAVCRGMYNHYLSEGIDLADYIKFLEGNTIANIVAEFQMVHGVDAGGIETPNNPNAPTDNQYVKPSAEMQGTFINWLLHQYRLSD